MTPHGQLSRHARQRCRGRALYSGAWPRFHSQLSSTRGGTPVRCAISSHACTRAGADLALGAAERERHAGVDARRQRLVVDEHAVAAQHVRDEVVGEDRQAVEVVEFGYAGEREVAGDDLGALVEAAVARTSPSRAPASASRSAEPPASATQVERAPLAEEAPELRSAWA